jgi:hypothetical protein
VSAIYTASWHAALAAGPEAQAVRISVGCPRGAKDAPHVGALAPYGLLNEGLDWPEFCARYTARLDSYGPQAIRERLAQVAAEYPGQVLLLCCYERDPSACHRGLFADWWKEQTGAVISEWGPPDQVPKQMSLLESKENR